MKISRGGIIAALLAVSTFVAVPAPPVRAQGSPMAPASGIKDPLGLTPAQQQKIQAITMKAMAEAQPIMQDQKLTQAQKMQKLQALNKKYEPLVMAVLTPAQRKKATAMQADAKKTVGRMEAYEKSLTPAQKTKIDAINKQAMKESQAINANKSLTPDQKNKKQADVMARRSAKLDAVLTPAQRAQRKQLRADVGAQAARLGVGPDASPQQKARMKAAQDKRAKFEKSLTSAQKLKIQKITDKFQADAMKIANDSKLSQQQKSDKIRALNTKRAKDTDAVLTPAQRQMMRS